MSEVFVIGDTHFGHKNILTFKDSNGEMLRNFPSLEAMHDHIIERWVAVVRPQDKVYHLGDVAFTMESLDILRILPGHKRLVRGNHDLFDTAVYMKYFEEIYGVRQINGAWLTHIPMHPGSLFKAKVNIHGHLHKNKVQKQFYSPEFDFMEEDIDPLYFNASVECINYTPVALEDIMKGLKKHG